MVGPPELFMLLLVPVVILIALATLAVPIWAIVDMVQRPDRDWEAAGLNRTGWLLGVILTTLITGPVGLVVAIVYLAGPRRTLRDAQRHGSPPAGWYPDPEGPGQRYWDGSAWTEHRHPAG